MKKVRVRMLVDVRPDLVLRMVDPKLRAKEWIAKAGKIGKIYNGVANKHGAVSVQVSTSKIKLLGVKPGEFEEV